MNNISDKFTVYRTLYTLNQGFEIVLLACNRLETLGCLGADKLRSCTIMTEELRALANADVADVLKTREEHDCTRLQNLRDDWETKLRVQGENMPRPMQPKPTPQSKRRSKRTRNNASKKPE